jgi:hypothetical protein
MTSSSHGAESRFLNTLRVIDLMKDTLLRASRVLLIPAALLASSVTSTAALAITNGSFGSANTNAVTVSDGGWFESTTATAWVEGTWVHAATSNNPALLMDGLGNGSYIYQSLGTLEAGTTTINLTADFIQKADDGNSSVRFDLLVGNSFTGAHGTDILGAGGVINLGNITLTAAQQGLTAASGDASRASGMLIGSFDVSSLAAGDQLWLRITDAADGIDDSGSGGDLLMDNLSLQAIPEPGSVALLGLGLAVAALRRRR